MKHNLGIQFIFIATILALVISVAVPAPVQAAGAKTHTVFVTKAIERLVADGGYQELVDILNRYPAIVNYGAIFPDLTYAGIDQAWGDYIHDDNFGYGTYAKYLEYLVEKGYDRTNVDLTVDYYKAFLDDPNYTASIPPYRDALMGQLIDHLTHTPRTMVDEETIAFLFGFIAHQEADWPWHWNPNPRTPGWLGVEQTAIETDRQNCGYIGGMLNPLNNAESCLDLVMYRTLGGRPVIDNGFINIIKSDVIAAAYSMGKPGPVCTGGTIPLICLNSNNDPFLAGLTQISYFFDLEEANTFNNAEWYNFTLTHMPGGINYGSAYVAGQWMHTWDLLKNYTSVLHVKPTASGTGDCHSWANACPLGYALRNAIPGQEIWVAQGVYKPISVTHTPTEAERKETFQLINNVGVYGGFAGTETDRDERDPKTYVTTLSGDIGAPGLAIDNSYHVVYSTGVDGTAILNGFTVTAGNAILRNNYYDYGGGMLNNASSPTVRNVNFTGNDAFRGGGMANISGSNPLVSNVTFLDNHADTDHGGGLYNHQSNPVITNVTFVGNSAVWGAAISNMSDSQPLINHVTATGNIASSNGGGMDNTTQANPEVYNSIFWANSPAVQIHNDSPNNGTARVEYCVIQNGYSDQDATLHNLRTDPMLGTLGDYGGFTNTIPILNGSSAIDAGDDSRSAEFDQRGVERPQGSASDIGAYEMEAFTLMINSPHGAVEKSPDQLWYHDGDEVTLTVVSMDPGWNFTGWSGDVNSSDGSVTITIHNHTTIIANYVTSVFLPLIQRE